MTKKIWHIDEPVEKVKSVVVDGKGVDFEQRGNSINIQPAPKQENGCPAGNHFDDDCRCQGEPIYPQQDWEESHDRLIELQKKIARNVEWAYRVIVDDKEDVNDTMQLLKTNLFSIFDKSLAEARKEEWQRCVDILDKDHRKCAIIDTCIGYGNAQSDLMNNPPIDVWMKNK